MPIQPPFSVQAEWYDLFYASKPYANELEKIISLLNKHSSRGTNILSLGCGTGRYEVGLAKMGYNVVGVDNSRAMLKVAERRIKDEEVEDRVELIHADARVVRINRKFDAALSLFCMVNYCESVAQLEELLANCIEHLNPQGLLIFDTWNGPGVKRNPPCTRSADYQFRDTTLVRTVEPLSTTPDGSILLRYSFSCLSAGMPSAETLQEEHHVRPYYPEEILMLSKRLHFVPQESFSWPELSALEETSWTALWILKKQL